MAERPASPKQTDLIGTLTLERQTEGVTGKPGNVLAAFLRGDDISVPEATLLITALFDAPRVAKAAAPRVESDVPAGRYALANGDDGLDFVQVDRPTKGRWSGYTFTKRLLGAPGDFREVRLSRADSARLLASIASDTFHDVHEEDGETTTRTLTGPEAAAVRFSRRFRVCAMCLSPLTDAKSRARGLGPVCASRL